MPDSMDKDTNRHRRPKPGAFKTPLNPTAEQARSMWLKEHRTDIASVASSLCAIGLCVSL
jgi:hypothetical protein